MKRYAPDEFAALLGRLPAAIEAAFRRVTPAVRQRVAGRAATSHMRDAGAEPVRRSPEDSGPLRITSRDTTGGPVRYLKAVKGGVPGSVDRVTASAPLRITYEMGVDLGAVPQGYNEDRYPTFTAAIKDEAAALCRIARDVFVSGLRSLVR